METQEILQELEGSTGRFPQEAVRAAVERRDEITPELLRIVRETTAHPAEADRDDCLAHLYAMFLLAQFREVRAYPLIVEFVSLPGELLDSLCGDFITESLPKVLASVCGGDLGGIKSLIENPAIDEWVRGAAVKSLLALVAAGQKTREEIVSYFGELFRGKLERESSQVWNSLVAASTDLWPAELMNDIEQAFRDGLVESGYIGWEEVPKGLARGKDYMMARLAENGHNHLVQDTIEEMAWWACFEKDRPEAPVRPEPEFSFREPVSPTYVREAPKIGRNDPCPCGSGKKFKKCCGG
jgi:hypothetical protein